MPGDPEEDDTDWFRPPWETEDEDEPAPRSAPKPRQQPVAPVYSHPLLEPLARAQDALTRLETRVALASTPVAAGLLARLSYREASGWLAQSHVWIHPHDLALRDSGLTSSYGAAFRAGRLRAELPWTMRNGDFAEAPSDIFVGQALRLARLWRRLAELRTWRPLADEIAMQEMLESLGSRVEAAAIAEWRGLIERQDGPLLVRIGRAAQEWRNFPAVDQRGPEGPFFAACLWGDRRTRPFPLPFWTAPDPRHSRLELLAGIPWLAQFLECVAAAATVGLDELDRLKRAEAKTAALARTARSRLPDAVDAMLRTPILTAGNLAKRLAVSPQAALALLRQLTEAGIMQEATGRASWRAFTVQT